MFQAVTSNLMRYTTSQNAGTNGTLHTLSGKCLEISECKVFRVVESINTLWESLKQRNFCGCLYNRCGPLPSKQHCDLDGMNETLTESSMKHTRIFMESCISEPVCLVRLIRR